MKRIMTTIAVYSVAIASFALQKAAIEVSYNAISPNFRTGTIDISKQYILLANSTQSKFFSPVTEYIDSLCSTPEGRTKYNEMMQNAFYSGKMDDMPRRNSTLYIVTSFSDNTIKTYDTSGLEKYTTSESLEHWSWQISDSTKTILNYECQMATTDYHGRKWAVWFTPEIPLQTGPWKLSGLPGLILEASADNGLYQFTATGIQQTDKIMAPVYLADDYELVSRVDYYKARRAFIDNPIGKINAQLSDINISASTLKYKPREEIDFIETDY